VTGTKEVLIARLQENDVARTAPRAPSPSGSPGKRGRSPSRPLKEQQRRTSSINQFLGYSSRWLREPWTIVKYFGLYLVDSTRETVTWLQKKRQALFLAMFVVGGMSAFYYMDGEHQVLVKRLEASVVWYMYWVVLGIASSIGLGTGLHTFMLFLGPFIAQSTMTAYKCQTLDFETTGPSRYRLTVESFVDFQ
jgi:hypothetical protein